MMTYERLAQILLANGVNSPAELEKVLRYVLVLRDRPLALDCPAGGGGSNQEGAGDPGGALVPDFVGQRYKDTNTGNIWIANSTTPGDWTLEVQDMLWRWTTSGAQLPKVFGFRVSYDDANDFDDITALTFLGTETTFIQIDDANTLLSLNLPNLTRLNYGDPVGYISLTVQSDEAYTLYAPVLNYLDGAISIGGGIVSLSLPSVVQIRESVNIVAANLSSISLPLWIPRNGKNFTMGGTGALNAASVNHILARHVANAAYVSGTIIMNGGTNAAPTGQGIADKATLIGRGATVTTN